MTKSRNSCHNTTFFVNSSFSSVRKRKSRKHISTVIEKMEEVKLVPTDPPPRFMFDSHQADADAVDIHLKLASLSQTETRGIDGDDSHPPKHRSMNTLEPKRTSVQQQLLLLVGMPKHIPFFDPLYPYRRSISSQIFQRATLKTVLPTPILSREPFQRSVNFTSFTQNRSKSSCRAPAPFPLS
jgi:hypothetical protein